MVLLKSNVFDTTSHMNYFYYKGCAFYPHNNLASDALFIFWWHALLLAEPETYRSLAEQMTETKIHCKAILVWNYNNPKREPIIPNTGVIVNFNA